MGRIEITATVVSIVVPAHSMMGLSQEVLLHDVYADGTPLPNEVRVNLTGQMRALDLMPGDQIACVAHLDAQDGERRVIGMDLDDAAGFLRSLPRAERAGVHFRLRIPRGVRLVRPT